jgi:hypothetical protein
MSCTLTHGPFSQIAVCLFSLRISELSLLLYMGVSQSHDNSNHSPPFSFLFSRLFASTFLLSSLLSFTTHLFSAFFVIGDLLSTSSAILFVLLYGVVFLFWFSFYR